MNIKRITIAGLAIFVFFQALDYFFHGVVLASTYASLASLWRPDMENYMWLMSLCSLVFSFVFVFMFAKGYEGRGVFEGIRFGFIISLLINVPGCFGQFAMYPVPFSLAMIWLAFGFAEFIAAGIIVSVIYRPSK